MKNIYTLPVLLLLLFLSTGASAQIFGRIINKATDKIIDKTEDRIAEEIANAIYRSIDRKMNDMFKEQYRRDSIAGRTTASYEDYMSALFKEVELPEAYAFDGKITYEMKEKKDKHIMDMYFSESQAIFGYGQPEENTLMIYDMGNDIIAIYDKDEKTVQALPNFINYAALATTVDVGEIKIAKTGKQKKVAGYNCNEYKIEDDEHNTKAFITDELPFTMDDTIYELMKKLNPSYSELDQLSGIILLSEGKEKKSKKKTSMKATDVDLTTIKIDNSVYKQNKTLSEED